MCSLIWAGHLHLVKLMVDLPFCECVYPNKYCTERMVGNTEEGCSLASHTIITLPPWASWDHEEIIYT